MRHIDIHSGADGWFWELRIDGRVVVFGWCESYERANYNARTA
jgi:hypothetical protein